MRARFGPARLIASAGSKPSTLNPLAVAVMAEIGIDIAGHRPKAPENIDLARFGPIVTLCADEVCPVVPGPVRRLHWPIADPAQVGMTDAFRATRDEIGSSASRLGACFCRATLMPPAVEATRRRGGAREFPLLGSHCCSNESMT